MKRFKRELYSLLPAFLFFLFCFLWINWLDTLMLRHKGERDLASLDFTGVPCCRKSSSHYRSRVVGEHSFSKNPSFKISLEDSSLWDELFIIRCLDHLIPRISKSGSVIIGYQEYLLIRIGPDFGQFRSGILRSFSFL